MYDVYDPDSAAYQVSYGLTEAVVEEIAPYLHDGQCLLFMNGCWGAIKACRLLSRMQNVPSITIAETANMPFIARLSADYKTLDFKAIKEEIGYSCLGEEGELSTLLHLMAPKVSRVASPASTSLSSPSRTNAACPARRSWRSTCGSSTTRIGTWR